MKVFKMIFVIYFIVTMFVGCDKHTIEKNKLSGLSVRNFLIEHDCNQKEYIQVFTDSIWSIMQQSGAVKSDSGITVYIRLNDWNLIPHTVFLGKNSVYKFSDDPKVFITIGDIQYYNVFTKGKKFLSVVHTMAYDMVAGIADKYAHKRYIDQSKKIVTTNTKTTHKS